MFKTANDLTYQLLRIGVHARTMQKQAGWAANAWNGVTGFANGLFGNTQRKANDQAALPGANQLTRNQVQSNNAAATSYNNANQAGADTRRFVSNVYNTVGNLKAGYGETAANAMHNAGIGLARGLRGAARWAANKGRAVAGAASNAVNNVANQEYTPI